MDSGFISIIMCVYNETSGDLKKAVDSILRQSYSVFEFIIILEPSTKEELIDVLKEYAKKDERILLYQNKERLGFPRSLNKAINLSKGEYIARMDADDISSINRLKFQKEYLDNHDDVSLVSGNYVFIDENNTIIRKNFDYSYVDNNINGLMRHGNVIAHPSVMFRKKDFDEIGGYRNLSAAEDYDLWLRFLINNKKIHVINKVLLKYRIRNASSSNRNNIALRITTRVLRKDFFKKCISDEYEIEEKINLVNNSSINRISKSYELFDDSWEKYQEKRYIRFLVLLVYSCVLNFDNIAFFLDWFFFFYYLKKKH